MIYLDNNATTATHKDVAGFMYSIMKQPLNPSSIHASGRNAKNIMEQARIQIKELIGIAPYSREYNIIFTATGTEANNLILSNFIDGDVFVSTVEHLSILSQQDCYPDIKTIAVDDHGMVNLDSLTHLLSQSKKSKKLVSVMLANNETGAIQPLKNIAKIAKQYGALVHSDCVQAVGKMVVDIADLDLDFAVISGHKFGGSIGAAALIAKTKHHLVPHIIGGKQEMGLRAGTENVAAIAGLGLAAKIAQAELSQRIQHMRLLQQRLESNLGNIFPQITILSSIVPRIPNTSLISLPGMLSSLQVIALDLREIAVSSGSACSSGKVNKSHVLKAMGVNAEIAASAIRISTSPDNSVEDIDGFINAFKEIHVVEGSCQL
ncbi:Cysteine desulfurase [Candidatus Trichorickettsia mobilis]|uniref:Cysteine desulfurase n=1 Tax=Candidatus Trichorickettsia mobilis TaxID=1346319 RepID=A0ABZ0USH5_9RICK|nr:cysteine desulfurase family protein [Candidatus Trichorickettsia mobilis]WPY00975.1 Cysteine desulfurase [Candidatus Trichorickettsia mobilis]